MSDEFRIAAVSYRALHLKFLALENELTAAQERLTEAAVQAPRREWVGLTDEEFHDLQIEHSDDLWANFKAIEAKLKEKNT